jgi:hypothetical protein
MQRHPPCGRLQRLPTAAARRADRSALSTALEALGLAVPPPASIGLQRLVKDRAYGSAVATVAAGVGWRLQCACRRGLVPLSTAGFLLGRVPPPGPASTSAPTRGCFSTFRSHGSHDQRLFRPGWAGGDGQAGWEEEEGQAQGAGSGGRGGQCPGGRPDRGHAQGAGQPAPGGPSAPPGSGRGRRLRHHRKLGSQHGRCKARNLAGLAEPGEPAGVPRHTRSGGCPPPHRRPCRAPRRPRRQEQRPSGTWTPMAACWPSSRLVGQPTAPRQKNVLDCATHARGHPSHAHAWHPLPAPPP